MWSKLQKENGLTEMWRETLEQDKTEQCLGKMLCRASFLVFPNLHINSSKYDGISWACQPFIHFIFFFFDPSPVALNMLCVCTPVAGYTKCSEWFTVECEATEVILLCDLHSSECMVVPWAVCAWIVGKSVTADRSGTTSRADISTIPNTHTSDVGGLPWWSWLNEV